MTTRPTGSARLTEGVMAAAWEELQSEAVAIVAAAEEQGVTLRVVGSAGIRLHCAGPGPLMDRLGRGLRTSTSSFRSATGRACAGCSRAGAT